MWRFFLLLLHQPWQLCHTEGTYLLDHSVTTVMLRTVIKEINAHFLHLTCIMHRIYNNMISTHRDKHDCYWVFRTCYKMYKKKVQYNRNSYCMIQSANQKQEMKSVPHPFQTCSKYFGSSNFGTGNKCCPPNGSMVCTNIILFLF